MSTINDLIQQARNNAESGNKSEAQSILAQALRQEPNNIRAWFLLSQIVEDKNKAIFCLKKVQELDPGNEKVERRLKALEEQEELLELYMPGHIPINHSQAQNASQTDVIKTPSLPYDSSSNADSKIKTPTEKKNGVSKGKTPNWVYILIIGTILFCLCSVIFLGGNNQNNTVAVNSPTATEVPDTPVPTATAPVNIGENGILYNGNDLVAVSIDQEALDELLTTMRAGDKTGLGELILEGKVFPVDSGVRVLVIDTDLFVRKVRILEGEHTQEAGWVPYEWIKPETINP